MWLEEENHLTPVPQVEPRVRKLSILGIAFTTVNPLLFDETSGMFSENVPSVLEVTTGANCCQQNCTRVRRDFNDKKLIVWEKRGTNASMFPL